MKTILFVCTGNTCRSPMAEAIFNEKAEKQNLPFRALSAGLYASAGDTISTNAALALMEKNIPFSHTAKRVNEQLVSQADYIFGMTESHAKQLCMSFPAHCERIYISPIEISDPFGGDLNVYRKSLAEIEKSVESILTFLTKSDIAAPVNVCSMLSEHLPKVFEIEKACFPHPWLHTSLPEHIGTDHFLGFVAEADGTIIGYLCMSIVIDEADITSVGVLPKERKKGIGSRLLEQALDYARGNGVHKITLEVRASNDAAKALYEKHGFQTAGVRKNYYQDPIEDGLLMVWK